MTQTPEALRKLASYHNPHDVTHKAIVAAADTIASLQSEVEQRDREIAELTKREDDLLSQMDQYWYVLTPEQRAKFKLLHKDEYQDSLRAQLAEARKDAARYRHMRNSATFGDVDTYDLRWYLPRGLGGNKREQLDKAIDAAIAASAGDDTRGEVTP
jgi:predicted RNase H-like nuclease (RuvC/YqgF family)